MTTLHITDLLMVQENFIEIKAKMELHLKSYSKQEKKKKRLLSLHKVSKLLFSIPVAHVLKTLLQKW